MKRSFK